MVIRQAFLSLLLFAAISNSSNTPDLVEEVDGTFTSPYMKYNTKKPDDFDDDDSMSDDTSWSADEDREMAETADKSYRDDDDDDGMRDDDVDSDKTVGKSKIQHKYAHIKTKTHKNDDEIENKDSQEDGEAVYEEKDISLEQDELDENKKGRKAKKHKDNKSDEDDEESVNEDERESNTEDLPRMEKVATSKQYPKHKDETPSQTDDAKDLKNTDSDDEKSDTKDKDDEKDTNRDEKADKNIEKVTNDKAPKITSKNKKSKDIEAEKLDANDQNKNNEKLKPGTSKDTETSDEEDTSKLTPTAGEDDDEDKKDDSKTSNFDSKTNSKNHNDKGNDDDKDKNGDKNKDDREKNENTTNENDLNETAQKQQTKSDRAKDAQKPQVTNDNNDEKDKVKEDTSAAQSIKNEDNQYKEIEGKTENKDPQPENKGDKSSKTILTEDTDSKNVSKPEHATTDVDKTIQQTQPTTDNNTINENTQKPAARTTSENPANSDTDKTHSNSNESKDKQDPAIATAKENQLNDNEPSTDKPANELNGNTDSSPPDAEKTNDVSSNIKDKSEKDNGGEQIPQRSNDLAKDNNKETNPGNLEQPDTKQEAGTLTKDIQNSQGKDTDPVNFDTKPKPDVGEESAILPNSKNMPQDSPSAQEMANKETNLKQDNPQEAATIPNNIAKGNQEEANPVNNGKEIAETLPENDNMSKLKQVNNGQEVAQGDNTASGESQGLQGKDIKESNPVHAETNPNENNGQVETGTTPVSNDIANVKQNVQEKVIEENSPVPGGDSIAAVKQNPQEKNINNSVQEQAPTTPEVDYIANVKQNLPQNDFKENSAINAGQEQSATVPGSNFADVKQNLQQNDINNPSQEQGARLAENDNGNVKQNPQENVGKDNNPGEQADVNSRNNNGQGLRLPSSDNMANDNHNSEEEINRKQDDSKSNKNKDIQNKVEQLSMNIGDQIKEDEERLKAAEVKSDDNRADTTKATGSSQAADTVPNQESKGEVPGGPTSTDKADVVSTLVEASSSNENSGGTSFRKVKDRTSGYNTEENLGDVTENKATQGKKSNVQDLLNDLVPSGILPNLPEGFAKLSEMSTVSFTYNVHENNDVSVTSDIKDPMKLFNDKLEISNAMVEFSYNDKETKGQKWQFKAQGTWVNGEQEIEVTLESSKHADHFTLTGKGDSLALHDYSSMFATQETFAKSGMNMDAFEEIMLSDIELYVVFKDFENIVSLVSGDVRVGHGAHASRCQTFIEKFHNSDPVFSILLDFDQGSPQSVLASVMADNIAKIPYVKELLADKGLLKVDSSGGFGFAASSSDVKKLRLNVFGEGMLERDLGSHISSGVTLTLPILFHSKNDIESHDVIMKISPEAINFFPNKGTTVELTKVFKTLSEFTRPKISSLGYPDVGNVLLREIRYDLKKSLYTVLGYSTSQFNVAPGMLYLDDAALEFRQEVSNEFATLTLYGSGSTKIGLATMNVSLHTNTGANELLISGEAHTVWLPDVEKSFGVVMEMEDDARHILDENRMLNANIENARMFATVKDSQSGLVHFSGESRPMSWNDAIYVETVIFHDTVANRRRMTIGYLFDKLPLTYAIDAFSFNQFPTPRLLDNSRNTTLVLSPVDTESLFLNPEFKGLSFKQGLSLVGQFRLPDVCSLNTLCESAAQLLGTEKWYRVQGLVSTRGYTLAGYVDRDFKLAKDLKLTDNILQFTMGNYSYMSIATAMRLEKNNLTFTGFVNFDPTGVRLRMSSRNAWSHPFPGKFLNFDRLQIDVPLISGLPMEELLVTGELNFGLYGSLYRIVAPAYLNFMPSKPKNVGFLATLANITLETITSALNFKSSLPGVLLNSRFPETLIVKYTPKDKKDEDLELYGKLDIISRTLICKLRIDKDKRITAKTSHSKFPLILDDGLITVYADRHRPRLGPRAWFTVTPESTKFKLEGFANFMGLGAETKIDVSESGTEFSLSGNLFGITKTVVSFMSPDSLPENGPYFASGCLPDIIPKVTSHVNLLVAATADQAQRYVKQASANYDEATRYHKQALAEEHKRIFMLDEGENDIESDDREMFLAEERYNKTCSEQRCGKTCIGCTSWLKCCDHDVFGNCVKCPGWKPCCWHGKNPICKAKNHACRIMKQVAAENLQKIAKLVYADKEKKRAREKIVWETEFLKGKTQAVLDAARRALHLVSHDTRVGLGAAESIKRFGLERLVNIKAVCFHTTLKTLATSCLTMRINATFAKKDDTQSLPYYGCLNRELVPKMANHIAHFMFHKSRKHRVPSKKAETKPKRGRRRSDQLFGRPLEEEQVDLTTTLPENAYTRRRREYESTDEDPENRPFWLIRNNYQPPVISLLQQRTTVPRSPLRRKWQIPASKKGKCKVYHQLVEICKDMMGTIKKMSESYQVSRGQYEKRLTELQLGLNTTITDLEKQVLDTPEMRDRLPDIEMNLRTVGAGVNQWKMNCEADQEDQNKVAIKEWVSTMEGRIRKLGGQGVERFLSNLFRAFEGMFLGADTPKQSAQKVLSTLQAIREISATFHDVFSNNDMTLEKANSRAEIVMTKLKQIKDAQIFCDV